MQLKTDAKKSIEISEILKQNNLTEIEETHEEKPSKERNKYSIAAHGAQFVEVRVDEDLGIVKVARVVEATATGQNHQSESRAFAGTRRRGLGNRNGSDRRNLC